MEYRYSEIRQDGRVIYGVAMPYGSVARLPFGQERMLPGVFGNVESLDVILNVQHNRERPLARTGGGGLVLTDSPKGLLTRADLPQTTEADNILELVIKKVLRGQSVEFDALKESQSGNLRTIERAALQGIGLVDRAAYHDTTIAARAEIRQLGTGLTGAIPYNVFATISDSGDLRKEGFEAGAFGFALQDESRGSLPNLGRLLEAYGLPPCRNLDYLRF